MPPLDDDGTRPESPDYVALVIEWDDALDEMDAGALNELPIDVPPRLSQRARNFVRRHAIAIACTTAGVLSAMVWRLRRRHA
ncbi:MAG TPA: hypothetical protein VM513_19785 [Kofleriaceae bacterium]|nr:hypothetical protein [Kofleriaceae bacterium]